MLDWGPGFNVYGKWVPPPTSTQHHSILVHLLTFPQVFSSIKTCYDLIFLEILQITTVGDSGSTMWETLDLSQPHHQHLAHNIHFLHLLEGVCMFYLKW